MQSFDSLLPAIASLGKLEELSLQLLTLRPTFSPAALAVLRLDHPQIHRLRLTYNHHTQSFWDLLSISSPAVQTLRLCRRSPPRRPHSPKPPLFPLLSTLHISHDQLRPYPGAPPSSIFLQPFFASPVTDLTYSTDGLDTTDASAGNENTHNPFPILGANQFPALRRFRIDELGFETEAEDPTECISSAAALLAVAAWGSTWGVYVGEGEMRSSVLHPRQIFAEDELGFMVQGLERVLEFGRREVGRIALEGDDVKAFKWVEMLRGMEKARWEWID